MPASNTLCSAVVVPLTTAGTQESNRTGTCCHRPPRNSHSEVCTALSAKAGETKQIKKVIQPSHTPAALRQDREHFLCGHSNGCHVQPCPCYRHVPLLRAPEPVPLQTGVSSRTYRLSPAALRSHPRVVGHSLECLPKGKLLASGILTLKEHVEKLLFMPMKKPSQPWMAER